MISGVTFPYRKEQILKLIAYLSSPHFELIFYRIKGIYKHIRMTSTPTNEWTQKMYVTFNQNTQYVIHMDAENLLTHHSSLEI